MPHDEKKHATERLGTPIHVLLRQYDLAQLPRVVKVDRFDADVRVEDVLVEENRTVRKVGHMKAFMKDFVFDTVRSFL